MKMFTEEYNEEVYCLLGKKVGRFWIAMPYAYNVGQPHIVEFSPRFAIANKRTLVGWIHTHPVSRGFPSSTDHATMKAWCLTEGGPLLCAIHGGYDNITHAHWYFDDENPPVEGSIRKIGEFYMGMIPKDPRKGKRMMYEIGVEDVRARIYDEEQMKG